MDNHNFPSQLQFAFQSLSLTDTFLQSPFLGCAEHTLMGNSLDYNFPGWWNFPFLWSTVEYSTLWHTMIQMGSRGWVGIKVPLKVKSAIKTLFVSVRNALVWACLGNIPISHIGCYNWNTMGIGLVIGQKRNRNKIEENSNRNRTGIGTGGNQLEGFYIDHPVQLPDQFILTKS